MTLWHLWEALPPILWSLAGAGRWKMVIANAVMAAMANAGAVLRSWRPDTERRLIAACLLSTEVARSDIAMPWLTPSPIWTTVWLICVPLRATSRYYAEHWRLTLMPAKEKGQCYLPGENMPAAVSTAEHSWRQGLSYLCNYGHLDEDPIVVFIIYVWNSYPALPPKGV